jgi:ribonucleoside-diphosphate reductase alpha chain
LKECLLKLEGILSNKKDGSKLSTIETHDIMCHIADAVLAGGIRRAAMISLFSADDNEMLASKTGEWWELNPQRGRANNSVVLLRHRIDKEFFNNIWERVRLSGSGEPGFYFSNDKDWGTNPCCEIALRPYQFCNLVEINAASLEDEEDYFLRCKAASFIGTLQASYTDFHYLRDEWKTTTEKEALIGVSMTGIASGTVLGFDMVEGSDIVKVENRRVAKLIGINEAARTTCVKPAGTTSLTLGTSSGIHAWHAPHYIRRIRVGKNEAIYNYLSAYHPNLIEDDYFSGDTQAVISAPQKAPNDAVYRTESALQLLKRVKRISGEWVRTGHREGQNTHNVSATISIKDDEWIDVGEWMWENRETYNGLSVLPFSGHTYKQAPFEDCSKETYEALLKDLSGVDLNFVTEVEDNTDLSGEIACAGGACEIDLSYAKEEVKSQDLLVN